MGPCHHGMSCPQVEDGQDSLLLWKEAMNILNKWSLTVKRGGPETVWLGEGRTSRCYKK